MRVSKILLEALEENELARLGISLKKLHEGQKCELHPGRGGCETQSQTRMTSHKLFCLLKERKKPPRNLMLLSADRKDNCAGTQP